MISYKGDVLVRQSFSEINMVRHSLICERVRKKIVKWGGVEVWHDRYMGSGMETEDWGGAKEGFGV